MVKLLDELESIEREPAQSSRIIINSLMKIQKLQSLSVYKECRINILERGMKHNTILARDLNVNNIISHLLSNPFTDRDEVIALQHKMYLSLMSIEISSLKKEITRLNELCAKERRFLKSITFDKIFKTCTEHLQFQKASDMILMGKKNEMLWKVSLEEKLCQERSIDDWLKIVSKINIEFQGEVISIRDLRLNNLTVSKSESVKISPLYDGVDANVIEEFSKPFDDTLRDANVFTDTITSRPDDDNESVYLNESTGLLERRDINFISVISEETNLSSTDGGLKALRKRNCIDNHDDVNLADDSKKVKLGLEDLHDMGSVSKLASCDPVGSTVVNFDKNEMNFWKDDNPDAKNDFRNHESYRHEMSNVSSYRGRRHGENGNRSRYNHQRGNSNHRNDVFRGKPDGRNRGKIFRGKNNSHNRV